MKKYLQNRRLIEIECHNCKSKCNKPESEFLRNTKLGRKMFCSRGCSVTYSNKKSKGSDRNRYDISKHSSNQADKYSPFRCFLRSILKRFKEVDLSLEDLLSQWNKQSGICPYTGIDMDLKRNTKKLNQASIDRIDSNKGYIKDNIEFVCLGINYLKSTFSKEEVFSFLKNFSSNFFEDRTISSS